MAVDTTRPRWVLAVSGNDHLRYRAVAISETLAELDGPVLDLREQGCRFELVEVIGQDCHQFPLGTEIAEDHRAAPRKLASATN